MTTLNIATYNVNGINDNQKRKDIFEKLKTLNYDIIFLQETHIEYNKIEKVKKEWGPPSIWNPGPSSSSGGTGTLLKNENIKIIETKMDDEGRILNIKFKILENTIQAINIYGPTKANQREEFYEELENYMIQTDHTILSGDFNFVENPKMDRYPQPDILDIKNYKEGKQYKEGKIAITGIKEKYKLEDKWRIAYPNRTQYTWISRKKGENIKSRIDRTYLSQNIIMIHQDIIQDVNSDHDILHTKIQIPTKKKRGKGYWKMNTSILEEPEYIQLMTQNIQSAKINRKEGIKQWWEETKLMVKYTTIQYCTKKAKQRHQELTELKQKYNEQKDDRDKKITQNKIQDIQNIQKKGTMIRSKEKTILNEDKPTSYFYIQEDRRQTSNTIHELHIEGPNDTIIKHEDLDEIRNILYKHHKQLYNKKETDIEARQSFMDTIEVKLTEEQKQSLEIPITEQEMINAIQDMENNKSPGPDGIPAEFYKTFQGPLKNEILELINDIFIKHQDQPNSQKLGYIKLIYKKGIKYIIINWRGITLLCVDHKITTKIMAVRLRKILPHLILEDQTCSIPDRTIYQNIYVIRDIIAYSNYKRIPTYLITYDFQNAFDTIDHEYMIQTLNNYNFGTNFIKFITTIYSNRIVQVMNNGDFTLNIPVKRGLSQGDPLSLPLFCLMVEPMANYIRQNKNIIGYHIPGMRIPTKITQYADDTNTATTDKESILSTYNSFILFSYASGCTLNPDKIKGMTIMTREIPQVPNNIIWNEETGLKVLGIHFFNDQGYTINYNWLKVLQKMEKKITFQKYRNLSLKGKITILNTTILAKVWYLATVYAMPRWAEKRMNKTIFKFMWGEGPEPIKREILYLPKNRGGLGLINITSQGKALRLKHLFYIPIQGNIQKWIHFARYWVATRLHKHHTDWKFLNDNLTPTYNGPERELPNHYKKLLDDFTEHKTKILQTEQKTTKTIYNAICQNENDKIQVQVQITWQNAFRKRIQWEKLWTHTYNSYNTGKPNDIVYKILHNCLPTRTRMKHNRNNYSNYNTKCKHCKRGDETTLHIFARCTHAQQIWKTYQHIYESLLPNTIFIYEEVALTINLQEPNITIQKIKLLLTITTIILYELWISRNKCEKENIQPNKDRSVLTINTNITEIIRVHYNHYKVKNDMQTFREKFTINKTLCDVDYHNILNLYLPP